MRFLIWPAVFKNFFFSKAVPVIYLESTFCFLNFALFVTSLGSRGVSGAARLAWIKEDVSRTSWWGCAWTCLFFEWKYMFISETPSSLSQEQSDYLCIGNGFTTGPQHRGSSLYGLRDYLWVSAMLLLLVQQVQWRHQWIFISVMV